MMNRATDKTLYEDMQGRHTFPPLLIKQASKEILELISEGLVKDGVVSISKFGSFRLKAVAARRGVNPKTGATLTIAAHQRVIFSPCKALRELIEPNPQSPIPITAESETAVLTTDAALQETQHEVPDLTARANNSPAAPQIEHAPLHEERVGGIGEESIEDPPANTFAAPLNHQREESHEIDLGVFESTRGTRGRRHRVWGVVALLLVVALVGILLMRRGAPDSVSPEPMRMASVSDNSTNQLSEPVGDQLTSPANTPQTFATSKPYYFNEQHHHVARGESLWSLADDFYHQPLLWPHIFQANRNLISNPDKIMDGAELLIPTLQGTPDNLSKEDQKLIAAGYRMLYNFYKKHSGTDAFYALLMAKHYEQGVI